MNRFLQRVRALRGAGVLPHATGFAPVRVNADCHAVAKRCIQTARAGTGAYVLQHAVAVTSGECTA